MKVNISATLKNTRVAAGLTQTELADKMKISQASVAALESENNKTNPTVTTLKKWADACEMQLVVTFVKPKKKKP